MQIDEQLFKQIKSYAQDIDYISISALQRKFLIGYQQASFLTDQLIKEGICDSTFQISLGHAVLKPKAPLPASSIQRFKPWIGSQYFNPNYFGLRVLVLGESHYGNVAEFHPNFTIEVVRDLAQNHRHSFFTKISKVLLGLDQHTHIGNSERKEIWEHIAFYNYIPGFVAEDPRQRPTLAMWSTAKQPFLDIIQELSPHVVLVLGKALSTHIPTLPEHIEICAIQHPSTGFSYQQWNPLFAESIKRARKRLDLP